MLLTVCRGPRYLGVPFVASLILFLSLASSARGLSISVPSPGNCTLPSVVAVSTSDNHCFDVVVRDPANAPISGSSVDVTFSTTPDFCDTQVHSLNSVFASTNASGVAHFCVCGSITNQSCTATISADGVMLGSRVARSVESTRITIAYSGTINGQTASYSTMIDQNAATGHVVRDDTGINSITAIFCRWHKKDPGKWNHSRPCCKETDSIEQLGPGPFDLVTVWRESTDSLTVSHHFTSAMSGDSLLNLADTAVWSGTAPGYASGSVIIVDPFVEHWSQVGPGHTRGIYTETYRVDGVPHTVSVVEDLTYPGPVELLREYTNTVSNFTVQYNSGAQTEHSEYDEKITPVVSGGSTPTPALGFGALIALVASMMILMLVVTRRHLFV